MAEQQKYSDIVNQRRNEMVDVVLSYIEQNPTEWQSGWQKFGCPINAVSSKQYRGINLLYLAVVSMARKYTDNRWVTFNQAKQLGTSVKKGEKSVPVLYYSIYDENTKKDFDVATVADMTKEERNEYERKYVRAYTKFYQVFNAEQCVNFPKREVNVMGETERQRQNELVESIIANSSAPVFYGGDSAYYSIHTDDIHLPVIEQFNTMQDYYATALHEIAHSTGHSSRLNRDMSGDFGSEKYAVEELRAELSSMFLQMENGIQLEGKHIENHSAYLANWLKAAKDNKTVFTAAVKDAMRIADYISEHYVSKDKAATVDEQLDNTSTEAEQQSALNVEVKVYYTHAFPTDSLGQYIPDGVTFKDFNDALVSGNLETVKVEAVYVNDSVVRERIFAHLAKITNQKYDDVYNQWLNAYEKSQPPTVAVQDDTKEKAELATRYAILDAAMKVARDDMSAVDARYTDGYSDMFFSEHNRLAKQVAANGVAPSVDPILVQSLLDEYSNPLTVEYYGWDNTAVKRAIADKIEDPALKVQMTKLVYDYDSLQDKTPVSESNPMLTVEAQQTYYFTDTSGMRNQQEGFTILHDRERDKWYLWNSDFIEGKVITPRGTRIRPTIGETAKRSEIVQTFENGEEWLTQFDSVEQAREYWNKESTRINALRAEYGELNEQAIKRQSEIDSLIAEKSLLFVENIKENEHRTQDEINAVRLPISEKTYREFTIGEFSDIPEHLQQFYIQKDKRPNAVVFVRMGDFYEAFGPDAQIIADKLDLTVTSRTVQGFEQRVPMIGIPYHAFESYAGKLNEFGIDVVSCAKTDEHYQAVLFEAQREQALNVESKLNTENKEQQVVDNNEQVLPSETRTQEISQTSWTKISIDENQVGTKFDKNTMIKLPNTEQLKGYVVFVPTKIVRKDKQGYFVSLKGDMSFTIKNDGMEMKVTASELVSLLQGKDVGKEPLRVGPKKINKDRIEALDSSLPSELKELNQWCAFTTFKDEQGNYKKKNIDVKTGNAKGWAKVNDPTTWTDFKTAKQYALENNCAGLTIVLTPESGVTCIDLDKCIDDAGNVSEFAQKVLKATEGTYAEKSVSGHGIHIFVKGDLLDNGKYKNVSGSKENGNEIEVYNQSKFISLTGNVIGDSAQNLNNIKPAQLSALHELMEKRPTVSTSKTFTTVRTATADVVEQRILRSKKKSEYQRLMAGDSLSGGDHSKDDFKLLNLLAFFSDCDASVMREIFMRSKLYREEGGVGNKKSTGYLDTSIKNAINSLANRPRGFADTEHQPGLFDKRKKKSITADNGNGGGAGGNEAGAE